MDLKPPVVFRVFWAFKRCPTHTNKDPANSTFMVDLLDDPRHFSIPAPALQKVHEGSI